MSPLKSITLLGSSSGRNAGDAALLAGIMDSIDEACDDRLLYEIPTTKPEFIWQQYKNRVRPIRLMPWDLSVKLLGLPTYRSLMRTNISLVFDAVLFDASLYNPLFNFLSSLSLLLPLAKKRGKKMGFFNVTAGPVATSQGRRMLLELAEMMDFITVRDQGSYRVLKDLGVKNPRIVVTADSALHTHPCSGERADEILRSLGFQPGEAILGVNINKYLDTWGRDHGKSVGRETFIAAYSKALNTVVEKLGVSLLFIATQYSDRVVTQQLMRQVRPAKKMALLTNVDYSPFEIKGVLGKLSLVFGMRLHCQILASSMCTPISGLAFLPKVEHYYDSLGLQKYCLALKDFSEEVLAKQVIQGWEQKDFIRRELRKHIPVLQRKALQAAKLVACLHRGGDVDAEITRLKMDRSNAEAGVCARCFGYTTSQKTSASSDP